MMMKVLVALFLVFLTTVSIVQAHHVEEHFTAGPFEVSIAIAPEQITDTSTATFEILVREQETPTAPETLALTLLRDDTLLTSTTYKNQGHLFFSTRFPTPGSYALELTLIDNGEGHTISLPVTVESSGIAFSGGVGEFFLGAFGVGIVIIIVLLLLILHEERRSRRKAPTRSRAR